MATQSKYQQAQSDFTRTKNMFDRGAATQQAYENAQTQLTVAETAVNAARSAFGASGKQQGTMNSQKETALLQARVAQANINQAQAALDVSRSNYNKAFVRALFDGIVSNRSVNQGQYVLGESPLASIVDVSHPWVTANFKETQITNFAPGDSVLIDVDAYPRLTLAGTVESIGGATGAKFSLLPPDNASGNFIKVTQRIPIRIALDSTATQDECLRPGLSVTANVRVRR